MKSPEHTLYRVSYSASISAVPFHDFEPLLQNHHEKTQRDGQRDVKAAESANLLTPALPLPLPRPRKHWVMGGARLMPALCRPFPVPTLGFSQAGSDLAAKSAAQEAPASGCGCCSDRLSLSFSLYLPGLEENKRRRQARSIPL